MSRRPAILLAALLFAGAGARAFPQEEEPPAPPTLPPLAEGPLQNDCFLPTAAAAGEALAAGDAARDRARAARAAGRREEAERELAAAFEGWLAALAASQPGEAVWLAPDPAEAHRATEGVEQAVLRRLAALAGEEQAAWMARSAAPAAAELRRVAGAAAAAARESSSSLPAALARLERSFPGTAAAAQASLLLADLALERGEATAAAEHARRGLRHAALAGSPSPLLAALEARRNGIAPRERPAAAPGPAPWETAAALEPLGALVLAEEEPAAGNSPSPERGVRPGLVFLDDRQLVVQTALRLHRIAVSPGAAPRLLATYDLRELAWNAIGEVEAPRAGREPPGWALAPAAAGERLLLVHGRASPRPGGPPNALLCLRLPGAGDWSPGLSVLGQRPAGPVLCWAVSGERRVGPAGEVESPSSLAGFAGLELQGAPLVAGGRVLVQGRLKDGDVRDWLLALELAGGELAWSRLLAKGADLGGPAGRFTGGNEPLLAPQPLATAGGRVFAGTHLGAGSLVEALDGRLIWSLRNRRRSPGEGGWGGGSVPAFPSAGGPGDVELLWAPADSDRLYRLAARPFGGERPAPADLFLAPPRAIGEAEILVGGDAEEAIVLGRSGAARALLAWRRREGRRIASVHLGPEEAFRGRGLAGARRAYASTDRGLYLFDRAAELYCLDYEPLAPAGGPGGGDVFARGSLVVVLGPTALWAFQSHPAP
ncbi:MAG: hypothetical protein AB1726_10455 [Planctomycetota bacterium]